jgi:hypothetical protein
MPPRSCPLAWSREGDPIDLPANAVGWCVRRLAHGSGGGAPQVVYDARGVPLIVEIGASVEDLGEAVGGRNGKYRLDCVDEYGRKLTSLAVPAAYVVIGEMAGAADGGGAADVSPALAIVAQLAKANGDAMTAVVQQISAQLAPLVQAATKLVEAVDSAGVSRRPAPPVVEAEIVDIATLQKAAAAAEPSPWRPVIEAVLPQVPVLLQAAMALLGSRAAPVISPPPPVVPT